ncbi:conserved hypothetical protein [Methylocella tundrae]|uniref:RNA polymerase sigma factor 70 region 4 type 2 domain-containing protein n=1 Tax=Methylocella tundrae TaxID=227605 RepID=A0A8B6M903_METTU|nr:conserved hypothetical protein [Methylocella tundrae]
MLAWAMEREVGLREDLNLLAPRLRRYARALVAGHPGPNEIADAFVGSVLRRALDAGLSQTAPDADLLAYSILIDTHREHHRVAGLGAPSFGAPAHGSSALIKTGGSYATDLHPSDKLASVFISNDNLSSALSALKLEEREALLLVSLEGFTYAEVARILKISRPILIARLSRARERLPKNLQGRLPARAKSRPTHLRVVK